MSCLHCPLAGLAVASAVSTLAATRLKYATTDPPRVATYVRDFSAL